MPAHSKRDRGPGASAADETCGRFFAPVPFAAMLAILIFAVFPDVVLGRGTFVFRDFGAFGYPLAYHHRLSFWRGEMSLWNPLNDCGLPFLAQWNTLVLYPFSLIYLLLPLPMSLNWFCLAHLFDAGCGMYMLARLWTRDDCAASVAGVAYAMNGLALHALMWPNNIAALCWMPWVILAMERGWNRPARALLLAVFAAALQMLTGAPEIIACTWLIIFLLWCHQFAARPDERRSLLWQLIVTGLAVAGLAAAQLLPFFDLLAHSERDLSFGAKSWAMPAWGWLNLLVPAFHCYESPVGVMFQPGQYWTSSYYLGIGVLALAIVGIISVRSPRVRLMGGIGALGLVLALGEKGLVYAGLQKVVPLFGLMRFPIKFVVLAVFAGPLLAAIGVASIRNRNNSVAEKHRISRVATITWILMLIAIGLTLWFAHLHPYPDEKWRTVLLSGLTRSIFLTVILAAVIAVSRTLRRRGRIVGGLAIIVAMALDVRTHAPRQNPTVDLSVFDPSRAANQFDPPPRHGEYRAMLGRRTYARIYGSLLPDLADDYTARRLALFGNGNLLDRIPTPQGLYSLNVREYKQIQTLLLAASDNPEASPLADFAGIVYVTDPAELFEWKRRETAMPLVSIGQRPVFLDPTGTLARLQRNDFDPRNVVYLPPGAKPAVNASIDPSARVLSKNLSAQECRLETESAESALLVLSQTYYHSWKAWVDGKETPLWRANYAFQALQVPPGRHSVRIAYVDRSFQVGTALSLMTMAACGGVAFRCRKKRSPASHAIKDECRFS